MPRLNSHNLASLASRIPLEVDKATAPPATVEEVRTRRQARLAARAPQSAVLYVFGPYPSMHGLEYEGPAPISNAVIWYEGLWR